MCFRQTDVSSPSPWCKIIHPFVCILFHFTVAIIPFISLTCWHFIWFGIFFSSDYRTNWMLNQCMQQLLNQYLVKESREVIQFVLNCTKCSDACDRQPQPQLQGYSIDFSYAHSKFYMPCKCIVHWASTITRTCTPQKLISYLICAGCWCSMHIAHTLHDARKL